MPAVTVEDLTTLTRVARPTATSRPRPVRTITTAPKGTEGEGFPVRRAFHGIAMDELDPFVHMDQMGEVLYAPGEPKGTPWHPHRGFETVTYMIDGTFQHRDSIGGGGLIENGGTQWMTAGSGILHIERPPEALVAAGGLFHGIQLWVNLPSRDKMVDPRYQDITPGAVTLLASDDAGTLVRVIAGSVAGVEGPGVTHTPIALVHATLQPGSRLSCRGTPPTTRSSTCSRARGPSATTSRSPRDSWPSWATATTSWPRPRHAATAAPGRSSCSCSVDARSTSPSPPTGRSS